MPAGTGVWVVNTSCAPTISRAVSKSTDSVRMIVRIRSRARKAAWPSLMW